MAYVLGFWRLGADMGVTGEFGITGVFSHWQVWILTAVVLQACSHTLTRYGRGGDFRLPQVLMLHFSPSRDRKDPEPGVDGRKISTP
jgi:hypothetical protein